MTTRFSTSFIFAYLLGLTLSLLSAGAWAQRRPKPKVLDALVAEYARAGQFSGTVLVAEKGRVLLSQGYGLANREWNQPNTPDTKFRIGSLTKQFTAVLVMQLVQQGRLRLDGHVSDYLPNYPKPNGERITLHQLLNHSAGIPNYTAQPGFAQQMRQPTTPAALVASFAALPLEFEPGSNVHYSNSNYFLLGHIIEQVSGKPYAQLLQENILTPLGMRNSGYDLPGTILPKRAAGYSKTPEGLANTAYIDMTVPYTAGALYSTTEDLLKWDQALYGEQLLSAASKERLFQPGRQGFGYGWITQPVPLGPDTIRTVWHNGGINGFGSYLTRVPQDQLLVVLLDNQGGAHNAELTQDLLRVLYGQPARHPQSETAPAPVKTIAVDAASLAPLLGKYELAPTFHITVTAEGSQLYAQATGQQRFALAATAPGRFSIPSVQAELEFVKSVAGTVEKLILHQGGRDVPGAKVE